MVRWFSVPNFYPLCRWTFRSCRVGRFSCIVVITNVNKVCWGKGFVHRSAMGVRSSRLLHFSSSWGSQLPGMTKVIPSHAATSTNFFLSLRWAWCRALHHHLNHLIQIISPSRLSGSSRLNLPQLLLRRTIARSICSF